MARGLRGIYQIELRLAVRNPGSFSNDSGISGTVVVFSKGPVDVPLTRIRKFFSSAGLHLAIESPLGVSRKAAGAFIAMKSHSQDYGYTIIELLVTMSLASVMLGIAVLNLPRLVDPAESAAGQVASFMKQSRARAVSSTSAVFVTAVTPTRLEGKVALNCDSGPGTLDGKLILELDDDSSITDITWTICFDSRGFADIDQDIPLEDVYGSEEVIEVYLGGAVRVR